MYVLGVLCVSWTAGYGKSVERWSKKQSTHLQIIENSE